MKISYIELLGEKHPLCFSLSAVEKLTDEFGSLEEMQKKLSENSIKATVKVLDVLLEAGRKYCEITHTDCPAPLPCSAADVIDLSDPDAVKTVFSAMSQEREVEVAEKN